MKSATTLMVMTGIVIAFPVIVIMELYHPPSAFDIESQLTVESDGLIHYYMGRSVPDGAKLRSQRGFVSVYESPGGMAILTVIDGLIVRVEVDPVVYAGGHESQNACV